MTWPQSWASAEVLAWKRYEAGITVAIADVPVSFICRYDTRVVRTAGVARPNRRYAQSPQFVRDLEHDVPGAVPGP